MPKDKFRTVYVCTNCGETSPRWMGRCPSCGAWNTMAEDVVREEKSLPELPAGEKKRCARHKFRQPYYSAHFK